MLFILSGNIQSGKTRWLERTLRELESSGIEICGVIAPGVWIEREDGNARDTDAGAGGRFEKIGIDNVLLPKWERIHLATRNDDALRAVGNPSGGLAPVDPSPEPIHKPKLWEFDDDAMARVNAHFDAIAQSASRVNAARRLLVVDEFGQLELAFGEGLTSALSLIDQGATNALPHALVVIREQLLDLGLERFEDAPWNGIRIVDPNDEARDALLAAFC